MRFAKFVRFFFFFFVSFACCDCFFFFREKKRYVSHLYIVHMQPAEQIQRERERDTIAISKMGIMGVLVAWQNVRLAICNRYICGFRACGVFFFICCFSSVWNQMRTKRVRTWSRVKHELREIMLDWWNGGMVWRDGQM